MSTLPCPAVARIRQALPIHFPVPLRRSPGGISHHGTAMLGVGVGPGRRQSLGR